MARYAEYDNFNDEVNILIKKCAALDLICRIKSDYYPFTVICEPDMAMEEQISMLGNPSGHNGKGDGFILRFTDSEPATDVTFKGNSKDFKTIFDQAKKVYQAFTPLFFRETKEKEHLDAKMGGRLFFTPKAEADQQLLDDALPDDVGQMADDLLVDEPDVEQDNEYDD